mgnify:CR=1 FL=1
MPVLSIGDGGSEGVFVFGREEEEKERLGEFIGSRIEIDIIGWWLRSGQRIG